MFEMSKNKKTTIEVKGSAITVLSQKEDDYICITDIARYKNAERTDDLVRNWLRNRNTIEFPGIWEQLDNPDFKPVEFDGIRMQAGLMQDLLTGKKRVTPLLNDTEVARL
jgi:KilA domain-containing protein